MYSFGKRAFDIIFSSGILIISLPILMLFMVVISFESPGSPLFLQKRIGFGGREFMLVKLRSMVRDAQQEGSFQTSKDDPRITRFGRFLRLSSLDELPQMWNVLKGDMSIIGPRPETPAQEALYGAADWKFRHSVKPGLTGLAQVNGRSNLSVEKRLKYDLEYAANSNFMMDLRIAFKTLAVIIAGRGAN